MGVSGFKWAELDLAAKDGRGHELLGKRFDKNEVRKLAQKAVIIPSSKGQPEVAREIIREKEVIVKIRCPYCHHTYNEALDKCPNCNAKN